MRTIRTYTKIRRIPTALSNYMAGCELGRIEAGKEMERTINRQPMDVEAICRALNNHRWTTDKFTPYRPLTNGFLIQATDPFGNDHMIEITETED